MKKILGDAGKLTLGEALPATGGGYALLRGGGGATLSRRPRVGATGSSGSVRGDTGRTTRRPRGIEEQ